MNGNDIGNCMRQAREHRGLSLSDAARLTKLTPGVLRAIERNEFDRLPPGMYRKAYLRILAAEVGLDPHEVATAYEQSQESPADVAPAVAQAAAEAAATAQESFRRRSLVVAAAVVVVAWLVLQPGQTVPPPPVSVPRAVTTVDPQKEGVHVASVATAQDGPLKIALTTTGRCWVSVERDGERVVYGLIESGQHLVVQGHRLIAVRLGDAGAVELSVNDEPASVPGAKGEVVEIEITADAVSTVSGLSD